MASAPIHRAPMRPRALDRPPGEGADFGLAHGLVGTGDALARPPRALNDAIAAAAEQQGAKAGRMLERFAGLPDGSFVWTRASDGTFHLGRVTGPWRYDDSPAAREVGIHHVRPADWLDRPFGPGEVPAAVEATFLRGGRNLQRTHGAAAEARTAELWAAERGAGRAEG